MIRGCSRFILAFVSGKIIKCGHLDLNEHPILCTTCESKRLKENRR